MSHLNRSIVLNTIKKHETLTVYDMLQAEKIGADANKVHLGFILDELAECGYVKILNGVLPFTYTITNKGITEGLRLDAQQFADKALIKR
jgi:hypothetical protein